MPKWVCFKLKKHVSLVRCCPHPKLVSPDDYFSTMRAATDKRSSPVERVDQVDNG